MKQHILLFLASAMLVSCGTNKMPPNRQVAATGELQAPDSVVAGSHTSVTAFFSNIPNGETVYIIQNGSWGTTVTEYVTGQNKKIIINDTLSGTVTIRAFYKECFLLQKQIVVTPLPAAGLPDTYLGSKSVIADGRDWAMITAVPTDKYGNLIKENSTTDIELLRPGEGREHHLAQTRYGIASYKITAGTKAGKTFAGISINGVSSKEKELVETAGFPASFSITAERKSIYADARQNFTIKTDVLKDRFGNIAPEGTNVLFNCTDADGTIRQLNSYTLGGIASISLQNPAAAGYITVRASVTGGAESNSLSIFFTGAFQQVIAIFDDNRKRITVGPLRGKLQQLVPNGTVVSALVNGKTIIKSETIGGYADIDVSGLPKGKHKAIITLFNTNQTVEFSIR
ncbi:hypothetical protein [Foetidibacter luteolus]|uniref:hypothetical protein n=1 Tax=Foetidibacter luteolus TaxID=2608880 RepID=UPI00129AC80A|nr:hypothetical protein [Foetidibacter luteolus]